MKKIIITFMLMTLTLSAANAVVTMCKKIAIDQCSKVRQWAANSSTTYGIYDYNYGYNDVTWYVEVESNPAGRVDGIARCTESSSNSGTPSSNGVNCWCRMTGQDGNNA
ncbi:MAG: hypothetical protein LBD94_00300, partial [Rickettsiales bacterium]|nr:hypothetical protein [Rickettsiales bacterium]